LKDNYANLDILRSTAVISVVAAHVYEQFVAYRLWPSSSTIDNQMHNLSITGVMFFFVHTCLVLMLSLERSPRDHRTRSFMVRRFFRIYPLCWATVLLVLVTHLSDHSVLVIRSMGWRGILANLVLIQNVTRDYPSIIGPLWSLPWEVQMYVALPCVFRLVDCSKKMSMSVALWTISAFAAIACCYQALPRLFHGAVFPPMFLAGVVAYALLTRKERSRRTYTVHAWGWPICILALFALRNIAMGQRSFESPVGAGIGAATCLVLASSIPVFRQSDVGWIVGPSKQIAKYSYSIYLLHIPALILVLRYLPAQSIPLKIALFLGVTGLMAVASFHLIEDPFIKLAKRITGNLREAKSKGEPLPLLQLRTSDREFLRKGL
jgi:peptidoglycan/LPS O-acetylase OafA/YrhL